MIVHYIVDENIFVVIVYKLLEQQKIWNVILKIALKLMLHKRLKCQKKGKHVWFKNYERK